MADRLSLANALADAKIDRPTAERIATEIFDAIQSKVATKPDLERLESTIKADFQRLEADFQRLEARADAQFQRLEARADAQFQRLEARMDAQTAALRAEMSLLEYRLLTRLGGLIVVLFGLLFAALRYLPPAH